MRLMKKTFLVMVLLMLCVVGTAQAAVSYDGGNYYEFWRSWIQENYGRTKTVNRPGYAIPARTNARRVSTPQPAVPAVTQNRPASTTAVERSQGAVAAGVTMTVNALRPSSAQDTLDTSTVPVFRVGVARRRTTGRASLTFSEAALLDEVSFRMVSPTGIAENPRDFELVIDGEDFRFEDDGTATVQFHNARLSSGSDFAFDVGIRVANDSTVSHIPGALQLQILNPKAIGESSGDDIPVLIRGDALSQTIVWDPTPVQTGTPVLSGNTNITVDGRTLQSGEKALVLTMRLESAYDDLIVDGVTLRDKLNNQNLSGLIYEVQAIDMDRDGQPILDVAKFSGDQVQFDFNPGIFVGRSDQRRIGFIVVVRDSWSSSLDNTTFELEAQASDIDVYSNSTGQDLSNSNKYISVDTDRFNIAQGTFRIRPAAAQPTSLVGFSALEPRFYFDVSTGNSSISLGRITFELSLSGMEYPGGISADDFALYRVRENGNVVEQSGSDFTASIVGDHMVRFDATGDYSLYKNQVVRLALMARLENVGDHDDNSLGVKILGDSTYQKGNLAAVRSSGANFIWSDQSAHPHRVTTSDWMSGYQVSGIPSNYTVIKNY